MYDEADIGRLNCSIFDQLSIRLAILEFKLLQIRCVRIDDAKDGLRAEECMRRREEDISPLLQPVAQKPPARQHSGVYQQVIIFV